MSTADSRSGADGPRVGRARAGAWRPLPALAARCRPQDNLPYGCPSPPGVVGDKPPPLQRGRRWVAVLRLAVAVARMITGVAVPVVTGP